MSKKTKGPNGEKYFSAYNLISRKYHFDICELSPYKAHKALKEKIGNNSYKWHWEIRQIGFGHPYVQHAYQIGKFKERKK